MKYAIEPFAPRHVPPFLAAAAAEGWFCDPWEFTFLLDTFPEGCWSALSGGIPIGFVTAFRHEESGWIGNLLIRKEARGRGLGRALFERALTALERSGACTVWLTASAQGKLLYEKYGFEEIDRVTRLRGKAGPVQSSRHCSAGYSLAAMVETDRLGWGDRRGTLLSAVAERGMVLQEPEGFCIVQRCGGSAQLGPWGCRRPQVAATLLTEALSTLPGSTDVLLDIPESNHHCTALLSEHGFFLCGTSTLMFRGPVPRYSAERIYALASMGSMG